MGTALRDHLYNSLPGPGSDLGSERNLSGLVALPAGVGGPAGVSGNARLGHCHVPFHDGCSNGIEWAEPLVPICGMP